MKEQIHIIVIGFGRSGQGAMKLAFDQSFKVTILDESTIENKHQLIERFADLTIVDQVDLSKYSCPNDVTSIVISPGIFPKSTIYKWAENSNKSLLSELEFASRYSPYPLIGITGTNGKTTSTELLTHLLNQIGVKTVSCGNNGYPISEAVRTAGLDYLVVEVSSFQLELGLPQNMVAAALTNITLDHLDRHETLTYYAQLKFRLLRSVKNSNCRIMFQDTKDAFKDLPCPPSITISHKETSVSPWIIGTDGILKHSFNQEETIFKIPQVMSLQGQHNLENLTMVLALIQCLGLPVNQALEHLNSFIIQPHRLNCIADADGVLYYNDSKATNPDAMLQAIKTCRAKLPKEGRIILIAGGLDKCLDFSSVTPELPNRVKTVLLLGENRQKLSAIWQDSVPCHCFMSMDSLVDHAVQIAQPGDTVLLSPGAASMDMFENYAHRGESFLIALRRKLGNEKIIQETWA